MALEAFVNGKKKKKGEKVGETLRFEFELAPSSEDSCNEFFYTQLVEEKTEKRAPGDPLAGSEPGNFDPLGEDPHEQEKLEAIARSFEEKYGSGPKKKKRKLHDIDLIDRGHGYDISDSFVDDSELYEDFVPPQVDTALGGFYINTGRLDFKCRPDLDPEEADFVMKKKKKPSIKKTYSHQKILATQKLKKAKQAALHKTPSKSGKKLLAGTGATPLVGQGSLTKFKSEKKLKKKLGFPTGRSKSSHIAPTDSQASSLSVPVGVGGITVPLLDPASKLSQGELSSPSHGLGADQSEGQSDNPPPPPKEPPILPESSLPPDVLSKVKDLEETIRWDQGNGKKLSIKTRSGYDEKLVEIELLCKAVSMKIRNAVFEFLAYRMGVAKGTLTKRMKAVLKKREDDKLEEPLHKLKFAVEESMPGQIAEYEEAKRTESVSSDKVVDVEEDSKMEDVFDESTLVPSANSSLTAAGGGVSQTGATTAEGAKVKKTIVRKRYKWTDEIRKLLCEVVRIKVESEESMNRINRVNGEDVVNQFLDEKVKPFWPKGWMQKSILYKMSEVAHKHFTNPQTKKAVLVKKEKPVHIKKEPVDSKPALSPSPATLSPPQAATKLTPTSSSSSARMAIPTDPKELVAFLLKDDHDLKKKELINKLLISHASKLKGEKTAVAKPHVVPGGVSSAESVIKSIKLPKSSPKKATSSSTSGAKSPKVALISPVSQLSSSGAQTQSTGGPLAVVPKAEKKRKTKQPKDSPPSTTIKTAAKTKSGTLNPPAHMLTTTTGQPLVIKYVDSTGGSHVLNVVSKVQSATQPLPMATAAKGTIVSVSPDGRLVFAGGNQQLSQQQQSSASGTQTASAGSKVALSLPSPQRVKSTEGAYNSGSQSSKLITSSNKSTPTIPLSRIVSPTTAPAPKASTGKRNIATGNLTPSAPPPPLTAASNSIHQSLKKATPPALHQQTLVSASVPVMPQVITNNQPNVHSVIGTAVSGLRSTVNTVTAVPALRTAVALSSSGSQLPHVVEGLCIPALSTLASPSTGNQQVRPARQALTLGGVSQAAGVAGVPPLIGTAVPETPPMNSSHKLCQNEHSPLKSPVEQIMEEHSYLGSPQQQQGQSPWPLHFGPLPAAAGEATQPHIKDSNVYTRDH